MIRFTLTMAALFLVASSAIAAPSVPTRGAMRGDIVRMNQQFHITGYNYRIAKIWWITNDSAFAQATAGYSNETGPGMLVFETPVKNTQSEQDFAPSLTITVLYKDGTQTDSDDHPYSQTGHLLSTNFYPGQGSTIYYAVANVPKPTRDNPVVKLILKWTTNNDPGYPPVYRLLNPVISPTP